MISTFQLNKMNSKILTNDNAIARFMRLLFHEQFMINGNTFYERKMVIIKRQN